MQLFSIHGSLCLSKLVSLWYIIVYYWNHPKHWFLGKGRRMVVVWRVLPKSCFLWSEKVHIKHRRTLALLGESQVLNTRIKPLRPSAQSAGQAFVWGKEGGNSPGCPPGQEQHRRGKKSSYTLVWVFLICKIKLPSSHLTYSYGKTFYRRILTSALNGNHFRMSYIS